jgi:hypothetical protein
MVRSTRMAMRFLPVLSVSVRGHILATIGHNFVSLSVNH